MSVRVVARIRPLLSKELDDEIILRAESNQEGKFHNVVRVPNPKKETEEFSFTFNAVYDAKTTQEEIFANEVAPHMKSLFRGLDVTIFAYGVTGTGKTHTMRGGLKLANRGVIPRLLSAIHRRGRKVVKDSAGETVVEVSLSYYEIYNDKVYDLFDSPDKRSLAGLPLREKDGKTIIVGLSEHACNDLKEFERLYIQANHNRSTAGTKLNSQSSRSHAILQVKVTQTTRSKKLISTVSAIDLAGSEDNRRTENNKERMVESACINKSLFVLSSCIDAIGRGEKRIPYRESKMTRILSLGQNQGITTMILNLAPLRSYHLDTLSSLNISSRAKRIEVREIENEMVFTRPSGLNTSIGGVSVKRQPLRSLANAHNSYPSVTTYREEKPAKSFSVYTDKTRNSTRLVTTVSQAIPKSTLSQKRSSETSFDTLPAKLLRLNSTTGKTNQELTCQRIEEIVEKKVQEALASRKLDQPTSETSCSVSESVQRRLEALEKKIVTGQAEESRAEGLRLLLCAKQHKKRGEEQSALKMYELAAPIFPGQEKLQKKIEVLKAKILAKREEALIMSPKGFGKVELSSKNEGNSLAQFSLRTQSSPESERKTKQKSSQNISLDDANDVSTDILLLPDKCTNDFHQKQPKTRKPKMKNTVKSEIGTYLNETDPLALSTPRTQYLLDIINSRDTATIKGLHGVGEKKARDLVEFLDSQIEDEGGSIRTLHDLFAVPGLGKRSVERAYEGVAALLL